MASKRFFLRALAHAHEDLAGYFQRPCEDLVDVLVVFLPHAFSLTLLGSVAGIVRLRIEASSRYPLSTMLIVASRNHGGCSRGA